jgi:hypothetical protein
MSRMQQKMSFFLQNEFCGYREGGLLTVDLLYKKETMLFLINLFFVFFSLTNCFALIFIMLFVLFLWCVEFTFEITYNDLLY